MGEANGVKSKDKNMKKANFLIVAGLWSAIILLNGCSDTNQIKILSEKVDALEKVWQAPKKQDVEARLLAVEKQLEGYKDEIKTGKLITREALFERDNLRDSKVEITADSIYITTGKMGEEAGSVAMIKSDELYLEDFKAFVAPGYSNGRGVRLSLEERHGDSPDVKIWDIDRKKDKNLEMKLSETGKPRTEAWFESPARKAVKGFSVVDGSYGPILIQPVDLKEIGAEGMLILKVATASAIPLSGLKAKLKYKVIEAEDENRIGRYKEVSFVIDKKMETGLFYPVSVLLGVSKEKVGTYFVVEKLEEKGVFMHDAP